MQKQETHKKRYLFSFRSKQNKYFMPRAKKKEGKSIWQHMFSLLF